MRIIKEKNKIVVLFLLLGFMVSCGKKSLSPGEYVQYMESDGAGMRKEKIMEDIKITVQYKTAGYALLKERKKEDVQNINEGISGLKGMQYYTIKYTLGHSEKDIMKYNLASESDYYERLNYMSFGMQSDVMVVQGKDTLPCILFNHVRNYGISPFTEIVLGFEEKDEVEYTQDKTLIINDQAFGLGYLKFLFEKSDLNTLPELKTDY